jgi:GNAT superfamily N-acetyltransferase
MSSDIKVRSFTGSGIKIYIPTLAKLRLEILKEYPFLCVGNFEEEKKNLRRLSQSKEAIIVLVFDGPKIVGMSTGLPMDEEPTALKKLLIEHDHRPADYYHFGEALLLKPYRGRGIGHHFFDLREAHVKHLKKYRHIALSTVVRPNDHPKRSRDYLEIENLWRKRGYVEQQRFKKEAAWPDIGETRSSKKEIALWVKDLQTH